jgi:serine protease DegQ
VTRGFIGIAPQDVTPELAESLKLPAARGSLVSSVNRGSPADKGGMKSGDVIVSIEGKAIQDSVAAMAAIAALKPGTNARFGVLRSGKEVALTLEIGKRPRPPRNR